MGNFEKLVVLTVVFTAAIVLAVSLNRGQPEVEGASPLGEAEALLADAGRQAAPTPAPRTTPSAAEELRERTSLLLSAGESKAPAPVVEPEARPKAETLKVEPRSDPSHRILLDDAGLRPSFLDEFMVYRVSEGDTWSGLAQRFYQDGRYTRNLHLANEGLAALRAGEEILVPVFDFIALDAGLRPASEPARTAERAPETTTTTRPASRPEQPRETAKKPEGATKLPEYEVQPGDTLSDISLAAFGTSTRWKEILEANSDQLKRPESLKVGMKLRIPEGGKLPPASGAAQARKESAPAAKKPEEKKKAGKVL